MDIDKQCEIEREEVHRCFDQYWKHSSVLRNWFVAYGIGALALVVYNDGIFFKDPQKRNVFVGAIVMGISLQILLTLLNKVIHWFVYYGKNLGEFRTTKRYRWSKSLTECFIIDIVIDILTTVVYARALFVFIRSL